MSYCLRLLYSAALLHMDQAALYRAMKALSLLYQTEVSLFHFTFIWALSFV